MGETYEAYLKSIRSTLESKCGRRKAEQILAEASAHLEEGIAELTERGMSRADAETAVIARFGDAGSVCKWYSEQHQRPSVWKASRLPLVAIGFSVLFWAFQNEILPIGILIHFGSLIVMNSLLAVTIVLCFRARRFVSGVIALATAGLFSFLILGFCLWGVPLKWEHGYGVTAKWGVAEEIKQAKQRLDQNVRLLATYKEGQSAFASATEPPSGVGKFHDSRGYLSQIYIAEQDPRVHVYFDDRPVSGIFPTYSEARNFWIKQPYQFCEATGRKEIFYMAPVQNALAQDRRIIASLPAAESMPLVEKLPIFVENAKFPAMFLFGFGIIADITGGILRILAELIKKRRIRGPITS